MPGLLLIPVYGRLTMVLGMVLLPYARKSGGIAHDLFPEGRFLVWIPGALLVLAGSFFLGPTFALILNGVFIVTAAFLFI